MTIVFLGIAFIILAILNWFGNPYMIPKKYRSLDFIKEYQKGLTLPYAILGIGFTVWGTVYNSFEQQDSWWFSAGIIVIAIIPAVLLWKNRKKYGI